MSTLPAPLLFPEVFDAPGLWATLGKNHGLTQEDFRWLAQVKLSSSKLRQQQDPPMYAERILLKVIDLPAIALPGGFMLSITPDDEKSVMLYTPYEGLRKCDSRSSLKSELEERLNDPEQQEDLLAFLGFPQRKSLQEGGRISLAFSFIDGVVFDELGEAIARAHFLNARVLHEELRQLPPLAEVLGAILEELLKPHFGALSQARTRVTSYTRVDNSDSTGGSDKHWLGSMSLSEAVLLHYRYQSWPLGQLQEYSNPDRTPQADDQKHWANAVTTASNRLTTLLFQQLEHYWQAPSAEGPTRRALFSQVLEEQARAELMLKRESGIVDARQFDTLHQMFRPATTAVRLPIYETVRLWEHQANYVELAGSLMISETSAFLYTPAQGLQVLKDYDDLKDTLRTKFLARGHEDELYALLSLEERSRFLGFHEPQVSGERVAGELFKSLFEAIITKQRQNIEYALQVFRHSDGSVNLDALFDKALDIRSMLHERLTRLDDDGRWSTRPVLAGSLAPSMVQAGKAAAAIKTLAAIQAPLVDALKAQPMTNAALQRAYLENLKPSLAHAWFAGVNAEAKLRLMSRSIHHAQQAIVNTVLDASSPTRVERTPLNGFRPDVYALSLECPGQAAPLPLAHCVLMTERGGIDPQHSGQAITWTPAFGLEIFENVTSARRAMNSRLADKIQRLALLENLSPNRYPFHQRCELGPLRPIQGNVLQDQAHSAIEHFMSRCEQVRLRIEDPIAQRKNLNALNFSALFYQLPLASNQAQAIRQQQILPAWLGKAPLREQQLHIELLEQWRQSVDDNKDYLADVPPLADYIAQRLKSLIDTRFPDSRLAPHQIVITPNLVLAGKACSLVDFALNHIGAPQGISFKVTSTSTRGLPEGLDQSAVVQLLSSLDIPAYAQQVMDAISGPDAKDETAKERFLRQVPWQLLQHAHALKLQQQLSETAFGYIRQVLDMPDAIARADVKGAHAIASPLSLIKTIGGAATNALGLYIFGPGTGHKGPQVLYSPYGSPAFSEFESESALIAALNVPGRLQDLMLRRLPENQREIFRSLLESTLGETSEMTLNINAIAGNFLERLFSDNLSLLKQFLGSRTQNDGQSDWETAKNLFNAELKPVSDLLQGKVEFIPLLWDAYEDFKDSAEALQDHHWKVALKAFIDGAAQMVQVALLAQMSGENTTAAVTLVEEAVAPERDDIELTSPYRTTLQSFEARSVALTDLTRHPEDGIYYQPSTHRTYAPVAGKVYRVTKNGDGWRLKNERTLGPALSQSGSVQVLEPNQIIHFGKALSKLHSRRVYARMRQTMINIEARGMDEIRRKYPERARVLVQAIDLARFYAFNCLHNLALVNGGAPRGRVHLFLEDLFDVDSVSSVLLKKIGTAIFPLCKALVDPSDDLMNTDRFVVGSNRFFDDVIAFVLEGDNQQIVHFTEHFFDQQLDEFIPHISAAFDIDGHAQASSIIHEFAHQFSKAVDIVTIRAREPFTDLISPDSPQGLLLQNRLEDEQRMALSLQTPRAELFSTWSTTLNRWIGFDADPFMKTVADQILKTTGARSLAEARSAFCDRVSPDTRIDVILLNADSIARLICEIGRQLDPAPTN
ncbi:hypothetical protein JJN09_06425 [Pseudomonas sp. HS6]|nr:DUF6543 domain-containing protein [Pseudomonas sp. HS6]UQS18116.1 hypothetical protein JJN09_06425 [Pseudomonas sp. HS6]